MTKRIGNGEHRPTHEQIAQRARSLYEQSGCAPGHDLENWLQAEAQLVAASKQTLEEHPETRVEVRPALREMGKPMARH